MDDDAVRIRPARPDEVEAAARLRWRWVLENDGSIAADESEYLRYCVEWARSHPDHRCTVAVRGDVVVGMAWLAIGTRVPAPRDFERLSGDIQSVYVVPEERGRGVGHRLLSAVVALADELGLQHVTVHSSARAVTAYRRVGFTTDGQYLHRVRGGAAPADSASGAGSA